VTCVYMFKNQIRSHMPSNTGINDWTLAELREYGKILLKNMMFKMVLVSRRNLKKMSYLVLEPE